VAGWPNASVQARAVLLDVHVARLQPGMAHPDQGGRYTGVQAGLGVGVPLVVLAEVDIDGPTLRGGHGVLQLVPAAETLQHQRAWPPARGVTGERPGPSGQPASRTGHSAWRVWFAPELWIRGAAATLRHVTCRAVVAGRLRTDRPNRVVFSVGTELSVRPSTRAAVTAEFRQRLPDRHARIRASDGVVRDLLPYPP
jgi:hypothetical protein